MTSNPDGLFQIDENTGVVTTAAIIDRETVGATRLIIVQSSSSDGSTADQSFIIEINDLNEFSLSKISNMESGPQTVFENSSLGTTVGITIHAFDEDATDSSVTYSLDSDAGGRFTIDSTAGIVTVANSSGLDFETETSHSIIVRATSDDGSVSTEAYTILVLPVNERPIALAEQYQTNFVTPLKINLLDLLTNDTDPENDALQIRILALPTRGTLNFMDDGTFVYRTESDFVGTVSIVYTVTDGSLVSLPQSAQIVITSPPNIIVTLPEDRDLPRAITENSTITKDLDEPLGDKLVTLERLQQVSAIGTFERREVASIVRSDIQRADNGQRVEIGFEQFEPVPYVGIDLNFDWQPDLSPIDFSALQRVQSELAVPNMIEQRQISIKGFAYSEETLSPLNDKNDYFVRTNTHLVVGAAIGTGISIHILASAHFGGTLLSHSALLIPLDPLRLLENASKKKTEQEMDIFLS